MMFQTFTEYETLVFFASVTVVANILFMIALERRYRRNKPTRLPVHIERELQALLSATPNTSEEVPDLTDEDQSIFQIDRNKNEDVNERARKLEYQLDRAKQLLGSTRESLSYYSHECKSVRFANMMANYLSSVMIIANLQMASTQPYNTTQISI
jgi:hypothetical protein